MKKYLSILVAAALAAGTLPMCAQMDGGPSADNGFQNLFGNNQSFSADEQIQLSGTSIKSFCKMYFDKGDERIEMDLSQTRGYMSPKAMAQAKSAGLDKTIIIARPGDYIQIYPNAHAYADMTLPAPTGTGKASVTFTPLGSETVAGHTCVKNKAVVTDAQGETNEYTVWNATDLKNFPVQIAWYDENDDSLTTQTFKNINFSKPDPSLFVPPSGFTKYDDMVGMINAIMKKKMARLAGVRPAAE